ncbi:hypothetical protein F0726_00343 [Acidithiobacillus caldus]|nr:hypothetical protein F0726_00343 [Acidithiobacillus caldus]
MESVVQHSFLSIHRANFLEH